MALNWPRIKKHATTVGISFAAGFVAVLLLTGLVMWIWGILSFFGVK